MNITKKTIELLAPARNFEIGIAAINCGADAVYIAAEKFGAREDAGNTLSDIEKLIAHAHRYYGKVYIALNTILRDDELKEAFGLIDNIYSMGADGLIIQDMGLLELNLPPIPLIASTQMNNDSIEKIIFLQNIGFKRVILPRELTLGQIRGISSKSSIELEYFIHGSLCVSYSGQCYMSYAIGGRSANRGACGQPCRRSYSLQDESGKILAKDRYLLSLKDLNCAAHLKELIDAGISSFKIEGRLKDMAYVFNITGFYRKKIDDIISGKDIFKSSSGKTVFDFMPDPYKTFNRGYTDYLLNGKRGRMASLYTPKSLGEKIGPVAKIKGDCFTLGTGHDLKNSDGICFFDRSHTLRGTVINRVQNEKICPDKMNYLEEKTVIYRNYVAAFVKMLGKSPAKRRIDISLAFKESAEGFRLDIRDEDGNRGAFSLPAKKTKAENRALAYAAIKKQLSSLNDTIFICRDIMIDLKDMYFIPLSILNQLRRGAIDNLIRARENNRPKTTCRILLNNALYPFKKITYLGNCLNSNARAFYERHGARVMESAVESGIDMSGRRVMIAKYCVKKELDICGKESRALNLIDEENRKYPLKFNCKDCVMEVYFKSS